MKKGKKISKKNLAIMISGIVLAVAALGVGLFFMISNQNKETFYTVAFDTVGGSEIESISVKENETINLPDNPTKEGYEFVGWTIIGEEFNKEMPVTEDLTLTAVWSKKEEEKKPEQTADQNPAKKYVCEAGYTLSGSKCVKKYAATRKCADGLYDVNGQCVEIAVAKKVAAEFSCKEGTATFIGYNVCKTTKRISVDSSSSCVSANGVWDNDAGVCYEKGESTHTCSAGYIYLSNPNQYESGIHGEAGCYPVKAAQYSCNGSDALKGTECTATVNAKLQ